MIQLVSAGQTRHSSSTAASLIGASGYVLSTASAEGLSATTYTPVDISGTGVPQATQPVGSSPTAASRHATVDGTVEA